jgi:hypothetical protein
MRLWVALVDLKADWRAILKPLECHLAIVGIQFVFKKVHLERHSAIFGINLVLERMARSLNGFFTCFSKLCEGPNPDL